MGYWSNLSTSDTLSQDDIAILEQRDAEDAAALREWHEWAVEPPVFEEAPDIPAEVSPAFRFGYEDGQQGAPFCPEMYFAADRQCSSYTLGFLTAQPGNFAALSWWNDFVAADETEQQIAHGEYSAVRETMTW